MLGWIQAAMQQNTSSESKNRSSEKNALCRWICNLRSFLNREFTVLQAPFCDEKSVQLVRGASFRSDFSSNLYFSALHIMHTWVGTKLQFQKIETLWIIIFAPFIIVHKLNATEKLIKVQENSLTLNCPNPPKSQILFLKKSPVEHFTRMTFLTPILVPDDAHINLGNPALLLHF